MTLRVYDSDFEEIARLISEGYREGNHDHNAPRIRVYEGRQWERNSFLVRHVNGFERFALFFTTLFKKFMLSINALEASVTETQKIEAEWAAVFSGRIVVAIYRPQRPVEQSSAFHSTLQRVNSVALNSGIQQPQPEYDPGDLRQILTPEEERYKHQVEQQIARSQMLMRAFSDSFCRWIGAANPLLRPTIIPLENAFAINIPSAPHLERISAPLRTALQERLGSEGILSQPEAVSMPQGKVMQYRLSLADMTRLLNAIPGLQLDASNEASSRAEFLAYGTVSFAENGNSTTKEAIAQAIAFTIAKMIPALRTVVEDVTSGQCRSAMNHLLPLVDIDDSGLTIRIPEGMDALANSIRDVCRLNSELEEANIAFRSYSHKFFIPRDDIKEFLHDIGLRQLPADVSRATHFEALVKAGHVHEYTPQHASTPLETLNRSLSRLVPNVRLNLETFEEEPLVPYTAMHPKGWLIIRLPKIAEADQHLHDGAQTDDHYAKGLKTYLGLDEPRAIDFMWHGIAYDREYRIDPTDLPKFLKKIRLEKNAEGHRFLPTLALPTEVAQYHPESHERDVKKAIAHNIAMLHPQLKRAFSEGRSMARSENTHFPQVQCDPSGSLHIDILPYLHEMPVEVTPGHTLPFGEYLSHLFGLKTARFGRGMRLTVDKPALRFFLENDLQMRALPSTLQTNYHHSYFDSILATSGASAVRSPYLSIIGWHLRNPTQPLPGNIARLTDEQIVQKARELLRRLPRGADYTRNIKSTLERAHELAPGTAALLRNYLILIVNPTAGMVLTDEKRRQTLESIAKTARECMPGRFTMIQQEYRYLVQPESRDQIKTLLLDKIEHFKTGLLAFIFNSIRPAYHVHAVAAAQAIWGVEFGFDPEAAQRDDNLQCGMPYVLPAKKAEFKTACQENLVTHLFNELSEARDEEHGGLQHEELYRARLTRILKNQGYTLQEIEGTESHPISDAPVGGMMDSFLPLDAQGRATFSKRALEALLIDIGVLRG